MLMSACRKVGYVMHIFWVDLLNKSGFKPVLCLKEFGKVPIMQGLEND